MVQDAQARGILAQAEVVIAEPDEQAWRLVEAFGLRLVVNQASHLGLSHSLRLGIESLEERSPTDAAAALIFLADQPRVQSAVVEALVEAWKTGSGPMIRPRYQAYREIPGHPVLLDRSIWPVIQHLSGDRGLAGVLEIISQPVVMLDVPGDNPDVDTPADLQALEELPR